MLNFELCLCKDEQMADWGPSDELALIADDRIVIAANECSTTQAYNISCAQCISYSPCGRYLAIGRDTGDEPSKLRICIYATFLYAFFLIECYT